MNHLDQFERQLRRFRSYLWFLVFFTVVYLTTHFLMSRHEPLWMVLLGLVLALVGLIWSLRLRRRSERL